MATTTETNKGSKAAHVESTEQIILGSYKDLAADFAWNSRSGAFWEDVESEQPAQEEGKPKKKEKVSDRSDWPKFKASILETGTNAEAILCRQPAKPGGKPRVVAGFRRFRAVQELAEQAQHAGPAPAQKGLIRYVIREMSDQEARLLNGLENIAREDISGPDLCAFVGGLVRDYKMSDSAIASRIGKSQPYVSKLHRFFDALAPSVLANWRTSPVRITLDDIEKKVLMVKAGSDATPSPEDQERYLEAVQAERAGKKPDGDARGKLAWIDTKAKEASDVGTLLGKLVGMGYFTQDEEDLAAVCWATVELPKAYTNLEPKEKIRVEKKIVKAFKEAFAKGVEAGEETAGSDDSGDDSEDEDEDEDATE